MLTTTADAGPAASAAPPPQQRLFDCLDAASKERITMLLSHYQMLLPVEQSSFMEELERYNEEQQALGVARGKAGEIWKRYMTPRLQAVQARDPAFVQPLTSHATATHGRNSDVAAEEATPPCALEDLLHTRGIFGEPEGVPIHVGKMSLYEKLHQNMRSRQSTRTESVTATITAAADAGAGAAGSPASLATLAEEQTEPAEGEREMGDGATPKPPTQDEHGERATALMYAGTLPSNASSNPSTAPYRNNAYQAVRLAMSSPGFIATTPPASLEAVRVLQDGVKPVLNVTAFPINEEMLREWFNELDVQGRGVLNLKEFQCYMRSLERDFGAPADYAALERDGARLAKSGWLSFEAFAYLVLCFVRV
ncbi:hypothetical protein LSCM1_04413 [Leishmania martiniquensis]|uniref:EF-hand domain-containing protein n=1 Tax=Leishmania martiniquensis TaxID=1580590 RepID=A0A836KPV6_9TRYP|nr:hypothetical protein LSCM1_04413 [Leishmania martiniquensis]